MKFIDVRDENGTTLQSYAELLAEKAKEHDFLTIMVFANREAGLIHTVSNVDGSVPGLLIKLGNRMLETAPVANELEIVPAKAN